MSALVISMSALGSLRCVELMTSKNSAGEREAEVQQHIGGVYIQTAMSNALAVHITDALDFAGGPRGTHSRRPNTAAKRPASVNS